MTTMRQPRPTRPAIDGALLEFRLTCLIDLLDDSLPHRSTVRVVRLGLERLRADVRAIERERKLAGRTNGTRD